MPHTIQSRQNSTIKHWLKLARSAQARREYGETLLYGKHLLDVYRARYGEPKGYIVSNHALSEHDTASFIVPPALLAELSETHQPQEALAWINIPSPTPPISPRLALLLERVQNPSNVGTILRSAALAGVEVVYLTQDCADVWSPKSLRSGQGAQFVMPVVTDVQAIATVQDFVGTRYALCPNGQSLYTQNLTDKPALFVLGNEGEGLSDALRTRCDLAVKIPMASSIALSLGLDSLNVAMASTVCLFEYLRQASASRP